MCINLDIVEVLGLFQGEAKFFCRFCNIFPVFCPPTPCFSRFSRYGPIFPDFPGFPGAVGTLQWESQSQDTSWRLSGHFTLFPTYHCEVGPNYLNQPPQMSSSCVNSPEGTPSTSRLLPILSQTCLPHQSLVTPSSLSLPHLHLKFTSSDGSPGRGSQWVRRALRFTSTHAGLMTRWEVSTRETCFV